MAEKKTIDPLSRTRRNALLSMTLFVVFGAAAAWVVARVLEKGRKATTQVETHKVVVAAHDITAGATLQLVDVKVVENWPKASIPKGSFSFAEEIKGRVTTGALAEGEPVVALKLAGRSAGSGLTALIPEDMRAMAVKVNEVIGVAGFLHPNDSVDVIAVMPPNRAKQEQEAHAKVILQNIRVLTVDQELSKARDGQKAKEATVVTLLVTPEDSERLALAAEEGRIRLSLRAAADGREVETAGITPSDLIEVAAAPKRYSRRGAPEKKTAPEADVVEVFHGKKLEERKIRPAGETAAR